jgi:hypothetical protein
MEIVGRALATQGFESLRLQTSPERYTPGGFGARAGRLRLAGFARSQIWCCLRREADRQKEIRRRTPCLSSPTLFILRSFIYR